jgi:hypothetical protein
MVGACVEPGLVQVAGHALGRLLQGDVDDGRAGLTLFQALYQQRVAIGGPRGRGEQREVRPIEPGHDGAGLRNPERGADVAHDLGRGRGSQAEHALGTDFPAELRQLQVVGTEVVSPLGDAMSLVDREERDGRPLEEGQEALVVEPLRRDVQQLQRAAVQLPGDLLDLRRRQRRVQPRRRDPPPSQGIDLILHQGDERGHDQRDPGLSQGGQLVTEGLASAGRKYPQRGAVDLERPQHLALSRPEAREPETLPQELIIGHGGHRSCADDAWWRRPTQPLPTDDLSSSRSPGRGAMTAPSPGATASTSSIASS